MKTFLLSAVAALAFATASNAAVIRGEIHCEGEYPWHLQGVATDGTNVYWTFTTVLVKTDLTGKVLAKDEIPRAAGHMGDLCCKGGKVYVGMNLGVVRGVCPGDEVWEYDGATLKLLKKYPTPEAIFCNNGIEWFDGSFFVITSAPKYSRYNLVFQYTPDFKFKGCRFIDSGWTNLGVQTICRVGDKMLFGCYGSDKDPIDPHPSCTLVTDARQLTLGRNHCEFSPIVPCEKRVKVSTAEGMLVLDGKVWEAHGIRHSPPEDRQHQRWNARLVLSKELN